MNPELKTGLLRSRALSEFEFQEVDWVWKSFIPRGCVTVLEGDGGVGKSSIIALLGSAISRGASLPGHSERRPEGILLLAQEDDPSTVLRPRFERQGADLQLVRCYDQSLLLNTEGLNAIESEIKQHRVGLVVIDPIVSFLGSAIDTSKATDVRSFMGPLHSIAKRNHIAIVVVRHWNKNSLGNASSRGAGSVDFRNAARSLIQVIRSGQENYFCLEKSNYGVAKKTLKYQFNDLGVVEWVGESDLTADEILVQGRFDRGSSGHDLAEAIYFLQAELASGPTLSRELESAAKSLGISSATLKRAKRQMGAFAFKMSGTNAWYCTISDKSCTRGSGSSSLGQGDEPDPHPHPHPLQVEEHPSIPFLVRKRTFARPGTR